MKAYRVLSHVLTSQTFVLPDLSYVWEKKILLASDNQARIAYPPGKKIQKILPKLTFLQNKKLKTGRDHEN